MQAKQGLSALQYSQLTISTASYLREARYTVAEDARKGRS
jgi:hypothetical protein